MPQRFPCDDSIDFVLINRPNISIRPTVGLIRLTLWTVLLLTHSCGWFAVFGTMRSVAAEPNVESSVPVDEIPKTWRQWWTQFDPTAEPLDVEVLHRWQEDGADLSVVRFHVGYFKGAPARVAAIYGYPSNSAAESDVESPPRYPGLVQIHGGGQYADYRACLLNAKRGYATVSVAWAGRISTPQYRVTPHEVKLFWEDQRDDPAYRVTTDWGLVDGYHAPSRYEKTVFPSVSPTPWTIDDVESPRNSGWFLCALAARRALTFLQQQPHVDASRLGVYGHSMGGKLTVMTAPDDRVRAAAPSCGGISDRYNKSELFRTTLGDDQSLKHIKCPIVFLSPANDFHGRIGDLPDAISEIKSPNWAVTCSPHHNHQDTPPYEVATMLWFDAHLKKSFQFPRVPKAELQLVTGDRIPRLRIHVDPALPILEVDVFYTFQGKLHETPEDREHTMHRFWHHAPAKPASSNQSSASVLASLTPPSEGPYQVIETRGSKIDPAHAPHWIASLPMESNDKPLWVYANVRYQLDDPVTGAGYYYGPYTADTFNVSSVLIRVDAEQVRAANPVVTLTPTHLIEDFQGDWQKEWFSYQPDQRARSTHKIYDDIWRAPLGASLMLDVACEQPNTLVVRIDDYVATVKLDGDRQWQTVELHPHDFRNIDDQPLASWDDIGRLTLSPMQRLRPGRRESQAPKTVGGEWKGPAPSFRNLRWNAP